uniref:Uncharacterized protein n=1 Tax=Anguilla anguilla TaxID=7936 RepID=A0A0E9VQK1_ANGAN
MRSRQMFSPPKFGHYLDSDFFSPPL